MDFCCFPVALISQQGPTTMTFVIKIHDIRHGFLLVSGAHGIPANTNIDDPCYKNTWHSSWMFAVFGCPRDSQQGPPTMTLVIKIHDIRYGFLLFLVALISKQGPSTMTLVIKIHDIRHGFWWVWCVHDMRAGTNNNDPCHKRSWHSSWIFSGFGCLWYLSRGQQQWPLL